MTNESSFNLQPPFKNRLSYFLKNNFSDSFVQMLRYFTNHKRPKNPQQKLVETSLYGFQAKFLIKNETDSYRLGNEEFEAEFGLQLIKTIANKPNAIFIDIGCAQGLYSILAARAGAAKVIAIDPDPISASSFHENLKLNPDTQEAIHFIQAAISNQSGETTLRMSSTNSFSPSLRKTNRSFNSEVIVPTATLDQLIESGEIITPDIIKIDVEGAEILVLQGMSNLLQSEHKPSNIFIEIHTKSLPLFESSAEDVHSIITGNGYKLTDRWPRGYEWLCHYQLPDSKPL